MLILWDSYVASTTLSQENFTAIQALVERERSLKKYLVQADYATTTGNEKYQEKIIEAETPEAAEEILRKRISSNQYFWKMRHMRTIPA